MTRMRFGPHDDEQYATVRDALVADFDQWVRRLQLRVDASDFELLLDWKRDYGDSRLDLWTRDDVAEFLLGWCPAKLSATAEDAHGLPSTVALSMSFLADRKLLAPKSDRVEQLAEYAVSLQNDFMTEMADPANFGMAKSLFASMNLDPATLTDATLDQAVRDFNAQTDEARGSIMGHGRFSALPDPVRVGPVIMPPDSVVARGAEAAPVLAGFATLAEFFAAPGKNLTQAGNIKLADARVLVEALETGDEFEMEIGDRVWKKHSSTRLIGLDHWQWWARESGALRQQANKLVGVKAWQRRVASDPMAEVRRSFWTLVDYGVLASYWSHLRAPVAETLDASLSGILAALLTAPEPIEFDELVQRARAAMSEVGIREYYPGELQHALSRLLVLLERAGVLRHLGSEETVEAYGRGYRVGGVVELTAVGTVLAAELAESEGVIVERSADPSSLSAADLAERSELLDADQWWTLTESWLRMPALPERDLPVVVGRLAADRPLMLPLLAATAPEDLVVPVRSALTELAAAHEATADIGSVTLTSLFVMGGLIRGELDPDAVLSALPGTLGAMAEVDPALVGDLLAPEPDLTRRLVARVSSQMPPRAVELLQAIGEHHPDKGVAKAARKELFRVRSRLAQQAH